jgi:anti-sigma factor RsiW
MKDPCAATSELLEKYFDHEVSDEERSGIETHIEDCPACRDRLKTMEGLRNLLKAPVDEVDQKEDFSRVWLRIERGIQQEETPAWGESIRRWIDLPSILRKRVWVPAAAVIVAIFLALAPSVFKRSPSSSDTSVVEYVESQNYNVMVYESEKGNVTVIWLFEGPEKEGLSPS